MSDKVLVVLYGQQMDEYEFLGNAYHVYRDKTLEEVAALHVPGGYEKVEECWECDDYVWVDPEDGRCIIIEELEVK